MKKLISFKNVALSLLYIVTFHLHAAERTPQPSTDIDFYIRLNTITLASLDAMRCANQALISLKQKSAIADDEVFTRDITALQRERDLLIELKKAMAILERYVALGKEQRALKEKDPTYLPPDEERVTKSQLEKAVTKLETAKQALIKNANTRRHKVMK